LIIVVDLIGTILWSTERSVIRVVMVSALTFLAKVDREPVIGTLILKVVIGGYEAVIE